MKKIISLFQRNYDGDRLVRDEVVPGAEWVLAGEGIATRKWDGTCCMIREGKLFKRYDAKKGKTPPEGFEPAQDPDPVTGHWPGWLPVDDGKEDQWFREGWENTRLHYSLVRKCPIPDGTYELIGPKVQGNPEKAEQHELVRHGDWLLFYLEDRSFEGIKEYLSRVDIEGIVFHHPDGRMVKIKKKDFGFKR